MKNLKTLEDISEGEKTEKEYQNREALVDYIEGWFGALKSVPWSKVSTDDLNKMVRVIRNETDKRRPEIKPLVR